MNLTKKQMQILLLHHIATTNPLTTCVAKCFIPLECGDCLILEQCVELVSLNPISNTYDFSVLPSIAKKELEKYTNEEILTCLILSN